MKHETVEVFAADIVEYRVIKTCAEQGVRNYRVNRFVVNVAPAVIGDMYKYVIAPFLRIAYDENHRDYKGGENRRFYDKRQ